MSIPPSGKRTTEVKHTPTINVRLITTVNAIKKILFPMPDPDPDLVELFGMAAGAGGSCHGAGAGGGAIDGLGGTAETGAGGNGCGSGG